MLAMLISVLALSISAATSSNGDGASIEAPMITQAEQEIAYCTCGGSYGAWQYPEGGECQHGRYNRTCKGCGNVQTAKDIYPTTVSFMVPAIGANVGDVVMLSVYSVYFTSSSLVSADQITWTSDDVKITDNCIYPTEAGTYKLTATAGTSTKTVYLVVKNPTDKEYVLFFDDFGRDTNGDGKIDANDTGVVNVPTKGNAAVGEYEIIQQPTGTSASIQGGKLVLNTLGNNNNQMRVILPKWIGDFGNYKIDTVFTIDSTQGNDNSRWFATMARIEDNNKTYFPIWQAAVRKGAYSHKSGVEIAYTNDGTNWKVPCSTKHTENIDASKYYTQTFDLVGTEAYYWLSGDKGVKHLNTENINLGTHQKPKATVGYVGFHLRASLVYVDSVKIVVPIDDSIHKFSTWEVTKAQTCTADGNEARTCEMCGVTENRTIKATGHQSYSEWEITKAATCTVDGSKQKTCLDCGYIATETIKAGHALVKHTAQAPTCTQIGYREYNTCENCDYTTFSEEYFGPFEHYYDREIKCIAHRGYSATAPENTLPAYILAKELGFNYAECDVAFTKDGVAVLLHDKTIDRTSNGSGAIAELNYEELLQYDFGSWKNSKYAGTKIPTFEEFIALCKEIGLHPYIEIKNDGTYTQEQVKSLVDTVEKYGMEDNCTWISFNLTYLEYVKNVDGTARLGYVSSQNITQSMINSVKALETGENEVFLDISYNMINENNAMLAASNGIKLEAWTVDNVNDIKTRSKYISGYTSNKLIATDTLVKTSVTAPTCAEEGYTTYTCLCGATKNGNFVPATNEHTYENGECTVCGDLLYCANPEHNLETITITYANGLDKLGVKVVKCKDCDAKETEIQAPVIFTAKGYSASEHGTDEISMGVYVDLAAILEYENVTGTKINYGAFAVSQNNVGSGELFDKNGNAVKGAICVDVTDYSFNIFHIKVAGITDEYKDDMLAMGAYAVSNGKYSYIQNAAPSVGEKYAFTSYNDIVNSGKEEENE